MFHMLSAFSLKDGETLAGFQAAVDALDAHLRERDLVVETGPIGERVRHPVMDTDENNHQYYFLMSFRDRAQCDRAVALFYEREAPTDDLHLAVWKRVLDPVFTCWQDDR